MLLYHTQRIIISICIPVSSCLNYSALETSRQHRISKRTMGKVYKDSAVARKKALASASKKEKRCGQGGPHAHPDEPAEFDITKKVYGSKPWTQPIARAALKECENFITHYSEKEYTYDRLRDLLRSVPTDAIQPSDTCLNDWLMSFDTRVRKPRKDGAAIMLKALREVLVKELAKFTDDAPADEETMPP